MKYRGPISWPINIGDSETRHFDLHYFKIDDKRYVAAALGDLDDEPIPLRIESACVFGHIFRGRKCDCGDQFEMALRRIIKEEHGLAIYSLDDDARGHGVEMHFKLYELRQHEGRMDEREIFDDLGLELDIRDYGPVIDILEEFSIDSVELMTNNPERIAVLKENDITVASHLPLETEITKYNEKLLLQEKEWLGYDTSYWTLDEWTDEFECRRDEANASFGYMITQDHSVVSTVEFSEEHPRVVLSDANASRHFTTCFINYVPAMGIPSKIDKIVRIDENGYSEHHPKEFAETAVSEQ